MVHFYKDVKPTFNLPFKSYFSGKVIGNNKIVGYTNGTNNFGFTCNQTVGYMNLYGSDIETIAVNPYDNSLKGICLTTDSSKSGIICESDNNIKMIIKY